MFVLFLLIYHPLYLSEFSYAKYTSQPSRRTDVRTGMYRKRHTFAEVRRPRVTVRTVADKVRRLRASVRRLRATVRRGQLQPSGRKTVRTQLQGQVHAYSTDWQGEQISSHTRTKHTYIIPEFCY